MIMIGDHFGTLARLHEENDRLRAENAELRKLIAECQSEYPGRCAAWDAIFDPEMAKEGESTSAASDP